jgi:PAS domain S-box-containing protein
MKSQGKKKKCLAKKVQKSLVRKKDFYADVISKSASFFPVHITSHGVILKSDKRLCASLGYETLRDLYRATALNGSVRSPHDQKRFLRESAKKKECIGFESTWLKKDKTVIPVRESLAWNADRTFLEGVVEVLPHVSCSVSDAHSTHTFPHDVWYRAIQSSGDGVWDWRVGTDEIYFSKNWKSMLGYVSDEIRPNLNEWKVRIHPEDSSIVLKELERHIQGDTVSFYAEYRMKTKSGDYKWIAARGKSVEFSPSGAPLRMVGTHTDISSRKAVEKEFFQYRQSLEAAVHERTIELIKSNAYAKSIISTIPSALIVVNERYEIFTANGKFFSLFRLPVGNIIGQSFCKVIDCALNNKDLCEIKKHIQRILAKKETFFTTENFLCQRAGTRLNLSIRIATLENSEGRVLVVFDDITQKKYFENQILQTERLAATGRLAASIAHEINNPLQGIITHLEIIREQLPQALKDDESYTIIRDNVIRIKNIVRQLLDIYRGSEIEKSTININDLILKIVSLVQSQIRLKHAELQLHLAENISTLLGWPQQIHQVLLNIVLNGLDAIPQAGQLKITTFQRDSDLIIKIRDNGPGISPDNLNMIFDPFFSTKKETGVGLGLFVCQGLVKNHNGTLVVNTEYSKGAEFIITLPID